MKFGIILWKERHSNIELKDLKEQYELFIVVIMKALIINLHTET